MKETNMENKDGNKENPGLTAGLKLSASMMSCGSAVSQVGSAA
jgi:hypothetical protein